MNITKKAATEFYKSLEKGDMYTDDSGVLGTIYIFISFNEKTGYIHEKFITLRSGRVFDHSFDIHESSFGALTRI